jgi:uncharacterized Ntn-hydrolase superfamily protein
MTFSIVARCRRTGQLGVGVSSAVPAVGALCPYLRPGIGAVTSQSWVNPYLAIDALKSMAKGDSAEQALQALLAQDEARDLRQVAAVDAQGWATAWTGSACTNWAGQAIGEDYAVVGNMLAGPAVVAEMEAAFVGSGQSELSERLMLALEAGEKAGGDKRGRQSAAVKVFAYEDYALLDLRVDEHHHPVAELRRVLTIARLQLAPFVEGMPRRGEPAGALPERVSAMLLAPPPWRPGGGGGHG